MKKILILLLSAVLIGALSVSCRPTYIFYPVGDIGNNGSGDNGSGEDRPDINTGDDEMDAYIDTLPVAPNYTGNIGDSLPTEDASDDPTADPAYIISSVDELATFAVLVNQGTSFEGKTVKLEPKVYDLTGLEMMIGSGYIPGTENIQSLIDANTNFKGTFDGQNAVILNYTIDTAVPEGEPSIGFFGAIVGDSETNKATVKNLIFVNSSVSAPTPGVGTLAGVIVNADVENIKVYNGNVSGNKSVGGIVGAMVNYSSVTNCVNSDTSVSTIDTYNVGGILGSARIAGSIEPPIMDLSGNTVTLTTATISAKTDFAGGIAGMVGGSNVTNNTVTTSNDNLITATGTHGKISGRMTSGEDNIGTGNTYNGEAVTNDNNLFI